MTQPGTLALASPGWGGTRVLLGPGQAHVYGVLERAVRHPSRSWHAAPPMRAFGRSSSTAHRAIGRLASLGVVAVQSVLGRRGVVRFTFGVRHWRTAVPSERRAVARIRGRRPAAVAPGQLAAVLEVPEPPNVAGPNVAALLAAGYSRWELGL